MTTDGKSPSQANLSAKSTGELELALIEELRYMELLGKLPEELREKLSRYDMLERQGRTGMRFGMVIEREELPQLRREIEEARRVLIDECLSDLLADRLKSVA